MQQDPEIECLQTFATSLLDADGFNRRRAAIGLVVAAQRLIGDDPGDRMIFENVLRAILNEFAGQVEKRPVN